MDYVSISHKNEDIECAEILLTFNRFIRFNTHETLGVLPMYPLIAFTTTEK